MLFGWLGTARLVRGNILSLREQDYATAAQALGASDARIMFRHLVPNTLAPLIVQATLQIGGAILTEAALSFLGFGIQPPVATWGNMLTNAQEYIFTAPWLALPPGFMIFITALTRSFDLVVLEYWALDLAAHRHPDTLPERFRELSLFLKGFLEEGGTLLLTSDHGNAEEPWHPKHTRNPVPLVYTGKTPFWPQDLVGVFSWLQVIITSKLTKSDRNT